MDQIGVRGRNGDAAKIILIVSIGHAELQVTESELAVVQDRRGTGRETDIAFEIGKLRPVHWRINAVKIVNLELAIAVRAIKERSDFH